MPNPRFSVVVPLYNKAAYVEKALHSIVSQTFNDWELILVDDGSTDESYEIARCYLNRKVNSHISYHTVSQENAGVSVARNNGVSISNGEFICFLDADDWWSPTFLNEINELIDSFPGAGIYGTGYYIVKGEKRKIAPIAFDDDFSKGYINYCQIYSRYLCMPLWTGAVCIPRSVFDEMNGFNPQLRLGEDFDLWFRISLKYRVAVLNESLAYYNQNVPVKLRATRNFHKPEETEYSLYSKYEYDNPCNSDLKLLLDKKRANAMMDYFLSTEYHEFALSELNRVNWENIPESIHRLYVCPKWYLKTRRLMLRICSDLKHRLTFLLYSGKLI